MMLQPSIVLLRLALTVTQAGDAVPYIKTLKILLPNLFLFMIIILQGQGKSLLHLNSNKQNITNENPMKLLADASSYTAICLPVCSTKLQREDVQVVNMLGREILKQLFSVILSSQASVQDFIHVQYCQRLSLFACSWPHLQQERILVLSFSMVEW